MSGRIQLRLLCPDRGESFLFMKWLARRYGTPLSTIKLRVGNGDLFDRVLALEFSHEATLVRVASPFPEIAVARTILHETLLRRIDAVMLIFARRRGEMEANANSLGELAPRLKALGIEPTIVLNDSLRGSSEETLSALAPRPRSASNAPSTRRHLVRCEVRLLTTTVSKPCGSAFSRRPERVWAKRPIGSAPARTAHGATTCGASSLPQAYVAAPR